MNRAANTPTNRASDDYGTVRRFSSFATGIVLDRIPPDVVGRAKLSILDSIGIGLASINYPFAEVMVAALSELAAAGECPVIGTNLRLTARDAAHLNGTLIHGLDFDDTHSESIVHTSASAIPTMISAGLTSGATGARALTAFIIAAIDD